MNESEDSINFLFTLVATLFVMVFSMDLMTSTNTPLLLKSIAWFFPLVMSIYTIYCGLAFFYKDE